MNAPVKECHTQSQPPVDVRLNDDRVLRAIVEGTASETGRAFFDALVCNVALALDVAGCWVTEYCAETRSLRALAFWYADHYIQDYEYCIKGTPCEPVIETREYVHFPNNLVCLFPADPDLAPLNAVSYAGVALLDTNGSVLGHLAIIDTKPQPRNAFKTGIFRVFASRAGAELRRLRAESEVIARETELRAMIDGAVDAIVVVDEDWGLVRMNPAARTLFGRDAGDLTLNALIAPAGMAALRATACMTTAGGRSSQWLPSGVEGRSSEGGTFPVEGTLSSFTLDGRQHYVLILRDVGDRERARETIRKLSSQTDYLRERLASLEPGEIIGDCPPMRRLRDEIAEVGPTNAMVLITGETGTGKELVAGALHRASRRAEGPFVAVNCAAVPANLMESEFFGHEEGAFTGATKRRAGRFALADGGTLFLDEVGELSPDVQAKLLRAIQEGEFEPVGDSTTCRVDVRVVAATNRDLQDEVRAGRFRQDLYSRLSVFPLHVPPLRERTEDIPLLAAAFIQRISLDLAKIAPLLTDSDMLRLQQYSWPGNVRELQNVLERAVITACSGVLDLARALPYDGIEANPQPGKDDTPPVIYTSAEMADLEWANLRRALDSRGWRVSGPDGAAALLGMPASTLTSRMKALGIRRP